MKSISFLMVLFSIILKCVLSEKITINEAYNNATSRMMKSREPLFEKLKTTDQSCVKDKLKLTSSGTKAVDDHLAGLFVRCSYLMCFSDKKILQDLLLDQIMEMQNSKFQNNVDCFKSALKAIDPDTKILNGFDPKNVKDDCAKVSDDYGLKKALQTYAKEIEPIDKMTCGAMNDNTIEKIFYSALIYKFGAVNADVLKDEKERFKDFTSKKVNDACNCIMGKI